MTPEERREHPRATLKWPVSLPVGDPEMQGVTKDISVGGAYVCCAKPLDLNEEFQMNIKAPDKSLNVKAQVVWTNVSQVDDEINPRGMGIRFLDISNEDRLFIHWAVREHNTSQKEPDLMSTLELEIDNG